MMYLNRAALKALAEKRLKLTMRERDAVLRGAQSYFAEVRKMNGPLPTNFPRVEMTLEEALNPMTPALALRIKKEKEEWRSRQR